jgi:pSer/pThr/pTyr-binding forkhead associated (FHA) protein
MLKLVVLSEGMTGRTQELKADKITIGRTAENTFQIAEASVSSRHCEVSLRGNEVHVKDLDSTNGTFISGEKITESVLKPGQILRLGQVTLRLETDAPPAAAKNLMDRTAVLPKGVSTSELDHERHVFQPRGTGFARRTNEGNRIFILIGLVVGAAVGAMLIYLFRLAGR